MPRDLVLDIDANAAGARRLAAFDFAADADADDVVVRVRPKHPARVTWQTTCDSEQLLCCRTLARASRSGISLRLMVSPTYAQAVFGKYSTSRHRLVNP